MSSFRILPAHALPIASLLLLLCGLVSTPAVAAPGLLRVTSFPSGAEVVVDGVPTGRETPALLLLEQGPRDVTVRRTGGDWEPVTRSIDVTRGRNDLDVTLVPVLTEGSSCWDLNENRQCDLAVEDSTGDGLCTPADCRGPKGEQGIQGPPGIPGPSGLPGMNGSSCRVVQEADGATIQCDDGTSARVFDGVPGPPGPSGSPLASLAELLGVEPSSVSVPLEAIQPADCGSGSASLALSVGGAPLGEIVGLVGEEEISRLGRFTVAVRMDDAGLDVGGLVGGEARLFVRARASGGALDVNGIVTGIGLAGVDSSGALYVAVIEPALARLQRSRGYASFFEVSIEDILQQVLAENGLDAMYLLSGGHSQASFEMQYDETDFDFVNRLMEDEGIFYWSSEDGRLLVGDTNSSFGSGPSLSYLGHFVPPSPAEATIESFRASAGLVSASATIAGFDPDLPASVFGSASASGGVGELYRFVPGVDRAPRASQLAQVELERARLEEARHEGTSNATDLRAGKTVSISGVGGAFSGSYLVTRVTHVLTPGEGGACFSYGNEFTAIPASQPFRPPRRTHRPRVGGVLSALVADGDHVLYRVKVRFPWNRTDEGESSWIRVGFPPGRKTEAFLPEIGDEVVVAFVGGDVREPLVIGGLWNGRDQPPAP